MHKKLTDWARKMVMQLRCWLPHRLLVLVGSTTAMPCWISQTTAASPSVNPLPGSPDCVWTPLSMRHRDHVIPGQNGRPPLKGLRGCRR